MRGAAGAPAPTDEGRPPHVANTPSVPRAIVRVTARLEGRLRNDERPNIGNHTGGRCCGLRLHVSLLGREEMMADTKRGMPGRFRGSITF